MFMILERSADTDAVIIVLRGINFESSYESMATQAGLTTIRFKAVLGSARRILQNEGIWFGTIHKYGLRRLFDEDKVKKPESFKKKIIRGVNRELKCLSSISNFGALSKTDQHSVTTNRTVLNVISQQAKVRPEQPKIKITPQPMVDSQRLLSAKKE